VKLTKLESLVDSVERHGGEEVLITSKAVRRQIKHGQPPGLSADLTRLCDAGTGLETSKSSWWMRTPAATQCWASS